MNIQEIILKKLKEKKEIQVADIVKVTGFSRVYVNRILLKLRKEGKVVLIGKTDKVRYVLAEKEALEKAKKNIISTRRILINKNLSEDIVLDEIKRDTGIFLELKKNISSILDYAFTEMLNNAIEHSKSEIIESVMKKNKDAVRFDVNDRGIGIFNNIMKKRKLRGEIEAIQDLLKGKQTTLPKEHTGEGIFFTSKVADILTIRSSKKKLIFNNILGDIFIKDIKPIKGTKITFFISLKSKTNLSRVFKQYTGDSYEFGKTKVQVRLFRMDTDYISRSQARRVVSGLEKFKNIVLDFSKVDTIGQAFADEVFRVWQSQHPDIKITFQNANENIDFMIKRALSS